MPSGARPGERRGGRAKGTKNKKTVEKEMLARRTLEEHGTRLAKDVIAELMSEMIYLAQQYNPRIHNGKGNEEKFTKYAVIAGKFAGDLVQYQSPKLATVKVGEDRENPFALREGVTSAELMQDLLSMFARGMRPSSGKLPELMELEANEDSPVEAQDGVANRED